MKVHVNESTRRDSSSSRQVPLGQAAVRASPAKPAVDMPRTTVPEANPPQSHLQSSVQDGLSACDSNSRSDRKTLAYMAAIGRFQKGDEIFYAKVVDGELFRLQGDVFGSPSYERKAVSLKGVKTLTPVAPSKVLAVGLNYADHARESGKPLPTEPLFWLKAPTSLVPDGGKIEIPFPSHRTDYEAELAIVIGRRMRNVTPAAAARYIFGYTAAQDISDRTIQQSESQWARAKSFDTFTPLGPYVETKIDPHDLTIQLFQNGQLRQNSNTSQLIFNCFQLVSFISTNMTLLPGDIILTGTPSGVGPIESGDRLEVRIQGLAPLVNTVK